MGGQSQRAVIDAALAAQRFAAKLPPRERGLLVVRTLHAAGDFASVDSAAALAARYPDDPDAQFLRADTRYHAQVLGGLRAAWKTAGALDSALAVDSASARVLEHQVTLAEELGDQAGFDRATARLTRLAERGAPEAVPFRDYALDRSLRWGAHDAASARYLASLRDTRPSDGDQLARLTTLAYGLVSGDAPRPDLLLAAYDATVARGPASSYLYRAGWERETLVQVGLGRLTAARSGVARLWQQGATDTLVASLWRVLLGYAPAGWLANTPAGGGRYPIDWISEQPWSVDWGSRHWDVLRALAEGDGARARRSLAAAESVRVLAAGRDSVSDRMARGLDQAAGGWATLVEGDSARALAEMAAGLRVAGYSDAALKIGRPVAARYLLLAAARRDTRAAAIDEMRYVTVNWYGYEWAWWHGALADALAAEGDAVGAAVERARLAALTRER